MKVSIVIPAYNAENCIAKCLDSILAQSEKDFEVIVVNDGSKDGTAAAVDAYAQKDSRIILINKENGGVSSARNAGLDRAQGDYVFFVDCDDWIPENALESTVQAIQESGADIVMGKMWHCDNKTGAVKEHALQEPLLECANNPNAENAFLKILTGYALKKGVAYSALAKLYRRDLIERYGVRFDKNLAYCEDVMFNIDYLKHANSAVVKDYYYYYAEDSAGSLTKRYNAHVVDGTVRAYEGLRGLFEEKGIGQDALAELEEQLLNSLWDISFRILSGKYANLTKKEYKAAVYAIWSLPIFVELAKKHRGNGRVCTSSMTAKVAKKAYGKGRNGRCYRWLRLFIGIRKALGRR